MERDATPLLSIVTICLDNRTELISTLQTVKSSNIVGHEHCVVDGSKEPLLSSEEVREWGITYLRQEGKGISNAFNIGVQNSHGKWLWFLNSGDQVHTEFDYPQWQNTFSTTHNRQILCGRIAHDQHTPAAIAIPAAPKRKYFWGWTLFWRNRVSHPGTFVGRAVFDSCGLYDADMRLAMDYEFWLRCTTNLIPFTPFDRIVAVFMRGGVSTNPLFANELKADEKLARRKNLLRWLYRPLLSLLPRITSRVA